MIKTNKNGIIDAFFTIYHRRLLRNHFNCIIIKNKEFISKTDNTIPTILYANHSNWWDGFIAYQLTNKMWKVDDYLMMDVEQMRKYKFFKYVGVFSVNRNDSREALDSINYAADLLKNTNRFLWIFPQGVMEVQDARPFVFYSGITKIAEKLGVINLVPVAFRYEFVMEQRPEVFVNIGEPDIIKNNIDNTKEYTQYLQQKLTKTADDLKEIVLKKDFDGFKTVFKGKSSRNKTVDKIIGMDN